MLLPALRWQLLRFAARLLFPPAKLTFGYLAEDLIAARLLGSHRRRGVYVDVGCNDPWQLSNTFLLWRAGWSGINIDANPAVIARMRRARPGDRCLCAMVGEPGPPRRFVLFADDAKSTADPEFARTWGAAERIVGELSLEPRRLDVLLGEAGAPEDLDFLNLDVEGMELEILRTLDLSRFRARLIAVEIHSLDAGEPSGDAVVRHLSERGYRLLAYNGLTAFFERVASGERAIHGL